MKKQLLFFICLGIFFTPYFSYAECPYYEKLDDCLKKNDAKNPELATDYLCVQSESDQEILFNIILDAEFSLIDQQAFDFLKWLEESKNYFFGADSNASFFQGIDLIALKFGREGEYWRQYKKFCDAGNPNSINSQVLSCLGEMTEAVPEIPVETAKNYLAETSCMSLVQKKLQIYEKIGYDLLKVNKAYVRKDNRKKFMQDQRSKYQYLLEIMRINIGYMERIWKKWPSRTKNTHG